jgi:hypothetical protein
MQRLDKASLFKTWHVLVERYTQSELTFSGDKLVALSGLVSTFGSYMTSNYFVGLWSNNLLLDLLWTRSSEGYSDHSKRLRVPPGYRAPTFSWASLEGPIRYYNVGKIEQEYVSFGNPVSFPLSDDAFGQIVTAELQVTGQLISATLWLDDTGYQQYRLELPQDCPTSLKDVDFYLDTELENVNITLSSGHVSETARRCRNGIDSNRVLNPCNVFCLRVARSLCEETEGIEYSLLVLADFSGTGIL